MPASFPVPDVPPNNDGWGPGSSNLPANLAHVPFAPFNKGEKLGRASDWTQSAYQKYGGRYQQGQATAVFNFFHNEEDENFHLVDNRPVKTQKFGQRKYPQNRFQQRGGRGGERDQQGRQGQDRNQDRNQKRQQDQRRPAWQNYDRNQQRTNHVSSIEVKPEWTVVEQIPFQSLAKLSCSVGEATDMVQAGELEYYDRVFDRITARHSHPLEKTKRAFRNVSTSDDPVIRKLASEGAAKVFATDSVLTTLMCVRSAKYSWDLIITKTNGKIFFDKRANSNLNLLTVNETAAEELADEKDALNGMNQLSIESTTINQNFSQQVLAKAGNKCKMAEPSPFVSPDDEEEPASCAYRYRKWSLNADTDILVRCEIDAAIKSTMNKDEDQFVCIKALNEFDTKAQDWRRKLESQGGAVLAYETKNNKNKVAKWTAGAILAGADLFKLGYVSRLSAKDNTSHIILGTQTFKPKDFAAQINLSIDHCWGIVRALVDMISKLPDGKFLLLKDPTKDLLRLYQVPADAFDAEATYADEAAAAAEEMPTAAPAKAEE